MTGAPPRIPVGCGAFVSFHPSLGSVAAYERAAPEGLPAYFSMPSMSRSGGPNFLGAKYAPFVVADDPNSKSFRVRDVALPAGLDRRPLSHAPRLAAARSTSFQRSPTRRPATRSAPLDEYYHQGYDLMTSAAAQAAFDIHSEPDHVRDAYGRNAFGQRALLARRLVEAGVPFVTLYDGGWDHHSDIFTGLPKKLRAVRERDRRADRGPRSPRPARNDAGRGPGRIRPHAEDRTSGSPSPAATTGPTPCRSCSPAAARPAARSSARPTATATPPCERVLAPENFVSTVYRKLGIDPGKIYYTPQGRPVHLVSDPTPISELMG